MRNAFDETESFTAKETVVSDETHRVVRLAIPSYTHGSLGLPIQADSSIPSAHKQALIGAYRGPAGPKRQYEADDQGKVVGPIFSERSTERERGWSAKSREAKTSTLQLRTLSFRFH